ncbi:MAG: GSCFA domain-containing protein [Bacteroidales bacterium]|nr:GSCFA domain-containing protein [Bacteroidales bacterium]
MIRLQTPVTIPENDFKFSYAGKILLLGSCFADNIGEKMRNYGFDVCVNPFGTLYNPVSILKSAERLESGEEFKESDCVPMGAGAGKICSFSHHTSFAAETGEEFLAKANSSLRAASAFWKEAGTIIITLGTAWTFHHNATEEAPYEGVVSNCLKRVAAEFTRKRLGLKETVEALDKIVRNNPDKKFIFTVSPIRHLKDGADGNCVSKAVLRLAADEMVQLHPQNCAYFPAFEIMNDELRDYRFYAEDMVHPSAQAVEYIWERFCDFALDKEDKKSLDENVKAYHSSLHRPISFRG